MSNPNPPNKFKKGEPRPAGAGRRPGAVNHLTTARVKTECSAAVFNIAPRFCCSGSLVNAIVGGLSGVARRSRPRRGRTRAEAHATFARKDVPAAKGDGPGPFRAGRRVDLGSHRPAGDAAGFLGWARFALVVWIGPDDDRSSKAVCQDVVGKLAERGFQHRRKKLDGGVDVAGGRAN